MGEERDRLASIRESAVYARRNGNRYARGRAREILWLLERLDTLRGAPGAGEHEALRRAEDFIHRLRLATDRNQAWELCDDAVLGPLHRSLVDALAPASAVSAAPEGCRVCGSRAHDTGNPCAPEGAVERVAPAASPGGSA